MWGVATAMPHSQERRKAMISLNSNVHLRARISRLSQACKPAGHGVLKVIIALALAVAFLAATRTPVLAASKTAPANDVEMSAESIPATHQHGETR
jgi:hypothetical protein